MDKLEGKRIDTIGLFSFKVDKTGTITESGVAINNMLTYINRWPHIRWLLTVANDGAKTGFRFLFISKNLLIKIKYFALLIHTRYEIFPQPRKNDRKR